MQYNLPMFKSHLDHNKTKIKSDFANQTKDRRKEEKENKAKKTSITFGQREQFAHHNVDNEISQKWHKLLLPETVYFDDDYHSFTCYRKQRCNAETFMAKYSFNANYDNL